MRWFIETWGPIDETDERWRLLSVFEAATGRLVAAATVFHFNRWVSKADAEALSRSAGPQLVVKVCQVLVLPEFSGNGHGGELLRAIYAHARVCEAVEVTVEDPNPRFRLLRDISDLRACRMGGLLRAASSKEAPGEQVVAAKKALMLTEEQVLPTSTTYAACATCATCSRISQA
jgi:GNAT superfamily N-acetyltransferase